MLAGLFTAQAIAFFQVYFSNLALLEKMSWVAKAGYLTVPNQIILPSLKMAAPAVYGGLFFTLSIGAGISLTSLACAWVLKYPCRLKARFLLVFLGLWVASIIALNWHGFVLMPSLYSLLVPMVVILLFWKLSPDSIDRSTYVRLLLHMLLITILALAWWTQKNEFLFLNIRDNLLLSNAPGIRFNDLYYRYTLYPAEAFRSLNQKLIKTYHLSGTNNAMERLRLIQKLARYDFLLINENGSPDVEIVLDTQGVRLSGRREAAIQISTDRFYKNPRQILKDLSERNDAYRYFRAATSLSLLVGFPLMLYWGVNGLLALGFSLILKRPLSGIAAMLVCGIAGILLLYLMPMGSPQEIEKDKLSDMLASHDTKETITALRQIATDQIDLHPFGQTQRLRQHPSIPVRYWLARGLSVSSGPDDEAQLIRLMQDPHPNVACQAIYSIGKRKFRSARQKILQVIRTSDHWYVQLYAYGALRKLGWKQTASN